MKVFAKLLSLVTVCLYLLLLPGAVDAQAQLLTAVVKDTSYLLAGYTSPNSIVLIEENSTVIATTTSDSAGAFSVLIHAATAGIHNVNLWAVDPNNVSSNEVNLNLLLIVNQEIPVTNLYLPATISTNGTAFDQNSTITIYGYTKPNTVVELNIAGKSTLIKNTTSDITGRYSFGILSKELPAGDYSVFTKLGLTFTVDNSTRSKTHFFAVLLGTTNTVDENDNFPIATGQANDCPYSFSKLCYFRDFNERTLDEKVDFLKFLNGFLKFNGKDFDNVYDINNDKHVDSADLSIFLYYWGGRTNELIGSYNNINSTISDTNQTGQIKGLVVQDPIDRNAVENFVKNFIFGEIIISSFLIFLFLILFKLKKRQKQQ